MPAPGTSIVEGEWQHHCLSSDLPMCVLACRYTHMYTYNIHRCRKVTFRNNEFGNAILSSVKENGNDFLHSRGNLTAKRTRNCLRNIA